ncbi:Ribonuclease kappa-B like protein [Argiope bruennichi]|uniref:Ribonuclease kappa-B like protein n=1 Tax=Argiope bruennichi TaxID=94029 RepID=A0A8T0G1J2_ARGBR|nr:Ribonuclease kappa-B like protein [Argiope bruennichi]
MLSVLGALLRCRSFAFVEDLGFEEAHSNFVSEMNARYTEMAYNCLLAAGLYILTFGIAFWQYKLNVQDGSVDPLF